VRGVVGKKLLHFFTSSITFISIHLLSFSRVYDKISTGRNDEGWKERIKERIIADN
jgi:hypothetical protein